MPSQPLALAAAMAAATLASDTGVSSVPSASMRSGDREHAIARDEGRGTRCQEIEHVGGAQARELQHVAEALGDEQPELQTLALEDGVDADGGAVREVGDVGRPDAIAAADLPHAFEDFLARAIGAGENLQGVDRAIGLVQDRKVGERSADINAYAISHIVPRTGPLLPPRPPLAADFSARERTLDMHDCMVAS